MKESEMLMMLMGPLVDELGVDRATAALGKATPALDVIGGFFKDGSTDKETAQGILDAIRLIELWCRGIREVEDSVEAARTQM